VQESVEEGLIEAGITGDASLSGWEKVSVVRAKGRGEDGKEGGGGRGGGWDGGVKGLGGGAGEGVGEGELRDSGGGVGRRVDWKEFVCPLSASLRKMAKVMHK